LKNLDLYINIPLKNLDLIIDIPLKNLDFFKKILDFKEKLLYN